MNLMSKMVRHNQHRFLLSQKKLMLSSIGKSNVNKALFGAKNEDSPP